MRITNAMVTSNTKSNININKLYHDKTNSQVASGQKILRPSDDPVIAIRALRLNTNLSELKQYASKNIPDAEAWFKATETALDQTDQLLTNVRYSLNQASSEENNMQSVKAILEELKQLKTQIYSTGNADDAGRTVFTGYRTSEYLTFLEPENTKYEIYDPISAKKIESLQYVSGTEKLDKNSINAATISPDPNEYTQQKIEMQTIDRVRLSYDGIDNPCNTAPIVQIRDSDGTIAPLFTPKVQSITAKTPDEIDAIYTSVINGNESVFIPETGEILLCAADKKALIDAQDQGHNVTTYYEKSNWQKGDLRPEHYFMCKTPEVTSKLYKNGIEYNYNRVDAGGNPVTSGGTITGFKEQEMVYEIGFGQTMQINSHASDVYFHDMGRDIDELANITQAVIESEEKFNIIKEKLNSLAENDPKRAQYESVYKAAEKEKILMHEKMHNMYEKAIDNFGKYQSTINKEISRIGAMTQRLALTKSRVEDQYDNVEELADKNINVDLDEIGLDYTSARTALEAARLAAGQIAESTLLNYI